MPTKITSSNSTVPLTRGQRAVANIKRFGSWVANGIKRLISFFSPKKKYINTDNQTRYPAEQHPLKARNVKPQGAPGTQPTDEQHPSKIHNAKIQDNTPAAPTQNLDPVNMLEVKQLLQQKLKDNFAKQLELMTEMGKAERLPRQYYRTDLPPVQPRPCGLAEIFIEQHLGGLGLEGRKEILDRERDELVEALHILESQDIEKMQRIIDNAHNLDDADEASLDSSLTDSMLLRSLERLLNSEQSSLSPEDEASLREGLAELENDDMSKWKTEYSDSIIKEFEAMVNEPNPDQQASMKSDILDSTSVSDFSLNTDNDDTPPKE